MKGYEEEAFVAARGETIGFLGGGGFEGSDDGRRRGWCDDDEEEGE